MQLYPAKLPDELRQAVLHRLLETGPQGRVAVMLVAVRSPLAAVVQAGYAGHTVEQGVQALYLLFITEKGVYAADVVVVRKAQKVLAPI